MSAPTALNDKIEQLRRLLNAGRDDASFDPIGSWSDLGRLVEAMESRSCFLMLNSTAAPRLKRIAAFHAVTDNGFPCVGTSEWGPFATVGEAVVHAAHEALFHPRAP